MELALCDGGMTRKSYITSSITAVIFATVVFPSFSLCVPSTCRHLCCVLKWLAEILPSPRMANDYYSLVWLRRQRGAEKVRVRAVYSSRYTHH